MALCVLKWLMLIPVSFATAATGLTTATWTTDVIVDTTNGYSFTLPSSGVNLVIWAASEADSNVIYQKKILRLTINYGYIGR